MLALESFGNAVAEKLRTTISMSSVYLMGMLYKATPVVPRNGESQMMTESALFNRLLPIEVPMEYFPK